MSNTSFHHDPTQNFNDDGVKIYNFQAGAIKGCMIDVRDKQDKVKAMLAPSLFLDEMKRLGMKISKFHTSKDIIGVDFDYGTTSYEAEVKKFKKKIENEKDPKKKKQYEDLLAKADKNKDKFVEMCKDDIRTEFYTKGLTVKYPIYKGGEKEPSDFEVYHYKMLFRSTGKAKAGNCLFIVDRLYDDAIKFIRMGLELPDHNAKIVEMGAYSSLISSGICGRVQIDPRNILVMSDYDSETFIKAVVVGTDEEKHCYAKTVDNYKVKNTMFDGQGLIDESIFPSWADGYVLLRHHFTKMACFKTKIQKYFKDFYGDAYETATITDIFGCEHKVKDIQLITTDNAVKWLKFDVTYDYWCEQVNKNDNWWGVVKYAHKSKLGNVQQMSYQMINSLGMDSMASVMDKTIEYTELLKNDDNAFRDYLYRTQNFSNDFAFLYKLTAKNPEFLKSEYFKERKKSIIQSYVNNVKFGKVINNGDNLVFVGSPYAMLMHAVGLNPEDDPTFEEEDDAIQVYTDRFDDNEYLAVFRSPHNSSNNIGYIHNHKHPYFKEYFDLGEQILAINMRHTDYQDRLNG